MTDRRTHNTLSSLFALSLVVGATPALRAQSLYGLDSRGGTAPAEVVELIGPSGGVCGYPNPVGLPTFAVIATTCPGPGLLAGWPGIDGDLAVNRVTDTIWVAGGGGVAEYATDGTQLAGFPAPIGTPLTGAGMDDGAGRLWLANAMSYARVQPGCGVGTVDSGPFANPRAASMTDLDWDAHRVGLWACFADGFVAHFAPGGAVLCAFDATTVGLGTPLTGIAVDTTTPGLGAPGTKVLMVTDGTTIARIDATGSCSTGTAMLAAASFAFPTSLWAVPGDPLSGLAFSAHGVSFGSGSGPTLSLVGNAIPGLVGPTIELTAAAPGMAVIFIDSAALCPSAVFKGLPLLVAPASFAGPFVHGGSLVLPATIPAATSIGQEIYLQAFNRAGGGLWESSPGLAFTTSRP